LPATLVLEFGLLLAGVLICTRATAPEDRTGSYALWALVGLLVVIYLANLFGPLPPSETVIAYAGLAGWLLVLWGYWIDRHRRAA
jgi:FtsH-binding integral membrane protein